MDKYGRLSEAVETIKGQLLDIKMAANELEGEISEIDKCIGELEDGEAEHTQ